MRKRPIIILKKNLIEAKRPYKSRNIPRLELELLFKYNIVELTFRRRILPDQYYKKQREVGHKRYSRHMLCTSNFKFISSPKFRRLYHWKRPKTRRTKGWYKQRGLLIVWDFMKLDWRMISLDDYIIGGIYPISTFDTQQKFTEFYRSKIRRISRRKKDAFSDK